jgi:hypothetical protein
MKGMMVVLLSLIIIVSAHAFDSVVSIEQNKRIINSSENNFLIDDDKFNIIVTNANRHMIQIFVYHNDQMFSRYNYPVKCEDTVIFHPATILANANDHNNEVKLYINREMQVNAITAEERFYEGDKSIIKIKDIADSDNKFNGTLYLMIFIDYNKNGIIESNEIGNITISFNKSNKTVLFNAKAYVSTTGYRVRNMQYPVYGDDYFYIKITSAYEKDIFLTLFGNDFNNGMFQGKGIRELDYSLYNVYILFTPITDKIQFYNNPYHYNGDFRLIFDIIINEQSDAGKYVYARNYVVEKNRDNYEMWLNNNGQLIKIKKMELLKIS